MCEELKKLIERAEQVVMAQGEKESQRRSFAWGNTNFENELITKDTVREAAESLERIDDQKD